MISTNLDLIHNRNTVKYHIWSEEITRLTLMIKIGERMYAKKKAISILVYMHYPNTGLVISSDHIWYFTVFRLWIRSRLVEIIH